jgi:hypothetical protein
MSEPLNPRKETNIVTVPPSDDRPPDDDPTVPLDTRPPEYVSLDELLRERPEPSQSRPVRHRRPPRSSWMCLAERILGGWAPALRATVLMLVVALCLVAAIGAAWGVLAVVMPLLLGLCLARAATRLTLHSRG